MNGELLAGFEYLERERGISRDVLIEAVESSLLSAARKSAGQVKNLSVEIERETGRIKACCDVTVVDEVKAPEEEITLASAREINPDAKIGDTIRREIRVKDFGRIAAQTAKQVIIQRIKEAEHKIVFNDYKDRAGEIITAAVRRYERGNVILDLGKAEAILPQAEQCPRESYGVNRRFKVYIVEVKDSPKGPEIVVSRSHPELVRKLFELEVPEIGEGTVEIKAVARDPGFRTKIAVHSKTEKVDPVGACVGMRGARVKDVVHELNGERVDIIRWSEDPAVFITNALSPAKPREVKVLGEGSAEIMVDDDQFSLAVGKKGQGIRLVSRLTGWKIDIKKASDKDREVKEAEVPVDQLEGLGRKVISSLVESGYKSLGALRKATSDDLMKIAGIGEKTAGKIVRAAAGFRVAGKEEVPKKTVAPAEEPKPAEGESTAGEAPAGVSEPQEDTRGDGHGAQGEGEAPPEETTADQQEEVKEAE
ncbi:MAG: transcription termination factor NusA [Candidatus Aureabacteria bacterium]|nr:transcription termination factor NusA [Candidatus Auribacterota bacterium]